MKREPSAIMEVDDDDDDDDNDNIVDNDNAMENNGDDVDNDDHNITAENDARKNSDCNGNDYMSPNLSDDSSGIVMEFKAYDDHKQSYLVIPLDSLKYGEYKHSSDSHTVRITQKDIFIDEVIFHPNSLQINFHCLSGVDPLLIKYGANKSMQFIWHAELAGEIVPEECEMRASDREYILKKKDPNQWSSGLLHCSSTNNLSTTRSPRQSVSYRYSNFPAAVKTSRVGLPPTGHSSGTTASNNVNNVPKYQRTSFVRSTRIAYSPHTTGTTFSNLHTGTFRSQSSSSILRSSSSSSLITSASSMSSSAARSSSNYSQNLSGSAFKPTLSYSSSSSGSRPTAKVLPYDERGTVVDFGFTGLRNIGNTCFMNATLQMLVNCKELQIYFTGDYYKNDVNDVNPLGFGGRLATVFAEFMKQMWSGMSRAYEPTKIKDLVAEKASQFANFAQHDAHEFLSFVIDGLHEDLNRIRSKPSTNTVEAEGRPDIEVSKEAWRNHRLRNDSIFVDLFHGQLKSRLQCPKCSKISITFDPFVYLSIPFPKEKRSSTVYFWPLDPCLKPLKLVVRYNADGKISELLSAISAVVSVNSKSLRIIEVSNHRIARVYNPKDNVSNIVSNDIIYVFQVHDPNDCNEEVIELAVVQRLLYRKSISRVCSNCQSADEKLKTCEKCYDAFYCKKECQLEHWAATHKTQCKLRSQADAVGQPFIISLPKSKLTYSNIIRNLECRCRHSVNVFQPPIESESLTSESNDTSTDPGFDLGPSTSSAHSIVCSVSSARRQMVFGELRNKSRLDSKLFLVRKLPQPDSIIGETLVFSDEPLDIPSGTVLSINWWNLKAGKDYLTVETNDDINIDTEKSMHFQKLSLSMASSANITSNPSLYDMLTMFSETERLKPEESWYCNKCKEHVEATKQLSLYRLPPILIIQLKRFIYTTSLLTMHRRSKDDRPVSYPIDGLELANYLADTSPNEQETKYDLTGVVCHSGTSYFGHYISVGRLQSLDGKSTDIDWRNFDDSTVSRCQASRAQNDDAYLLFYKQRGSRTQNLLNEKYGINCLND